MRQSDTLFLSDAAAHMAAWRHSLRMSLRELAGLMRCDHAYLWRHERGLRDPSPAFLARWEGALSAATVGSFAEIPGDAGACECFAAAGNDGAAPVELAELAALCDDGNDDEGGAA